MIIIDDLYCSRLGLMAVFEKVHELAEQERVDESAKRRTLRSKPCMNSRSNF